MESCEKDDYFTVVDGETRCYAACTADYPFHEEGSRQCTTCPERAPYWTGTECAATCPGSAPLADGGRCTECPNNALYWDPSAKACVSECAQGLTLEEARVCQTCASGKFLDPETKTCVASCATLADEDGVCRTCGQNAPLWSQLTRECVSACPAGLSAVDNVCPTCYEDAQMRARGRVYFDADADECVSRCHWVDYDKTRCVSCDDDAPFWNPMSKKCVSACPRGQPLSNGECPACEEGAYFDEIDNACRRDCRSFDAYYTEVQVCKWCEGETPYWNGTGCAANCGTGTYHAVGHHFVCDDVELVCYWPGVCAACAEKDERRPYWNGEACVSCSRGTGGGEPYFDKVGGKCTDSCPEATPLIGAGYICRPCPAGAPYWDYLECKSCAGVFPGSRGYWSPFYNACVAACPAGLEPLDGSEKCRSCAEVYQDKPYWDPRAEECTACPRGTYGQICQPCDEWKPEMPVWDEENQRCASCAVVYGPGRAIWDPNSRMCVASCVVGDPLSSSGLEIDYDETTWCAKCEAVHDGYPVWDADAGKCV